MVRIWKLKREFLPLETPDFPEEKGFTKILGRDIKKSDIVCKSDNVSRMHCQIRFDGRHWTLSDLKSLNGVYLNDRLLNKGEAVKLRHNDHIGISIGYPEDAMQEGPNYFTFRFLREDPDPPIKKEKDNDEEDDIEILGEFVKPSKPIPSKATPLPSPKVKSTHIVIPPPPESLDELAAISNMVNDIIAQDALEEKKTEKPRIAPPPPKISHLITKPSSSSSAESGEIKSSEESQSSASSLLSQAGIKAAFNKFLAEEKAEKKKQGLEIDKEKIKQAFQAFTRDELKNNDKSEVPSTSARTSGKPVPSSSSKDQKDKGKESPTIEIGSSSEEEGIEFLGEEKQVEEVQIEPPKGKKSGVEDGNKDEEEAEEEWEEMPEAWEDFYNEGEAAEDDDGSSRVDPNKKRKKAGQKDDDEEDWDAPPPSKRRKESDSSSDKTDFSEEGEKSVEELLRDERINRLKLKNMEASKTKIISTNYVHHMPGRRGKAPPIPPPNPKFNAIRTFKSLQRSVSTEGKQPLGKRIVIPVKNVNSRNQGLLDDLLKSTLNGPPCKRPAPSSSNPVAVAGSSSSTSVEAANSLAKAKEDEDRKNKMLKPGPSPITRAVARPIASSNPTALFNDYVHSGKKWNFDADAYRDIFHWKPEWIEEQERNERNNKKALPPVTNHRAIRIALKEYADFEVYQSVFYPLLLLELWGSMMQEYRNVRGFGPAHNRETMEFECGIESIRSSFECPLFENRFRHERRRDRKKKVVQDTTPWHLVRILLFSERRNPIDKRFDLVVLSLKRKDRKAQVDGDKSEKKTDEDPQKDPQKPKEEPSKIKKIFGIILPNSEVIEEVSHATSVHPVLFAKFNASDRGNGPQFKISFVIITHFKFDTEDILKNEICSVQKISYISSTIRVFRSLSNFPTSPLFPKILHPEKNCEEGRDFSISPPPSALVEYVNKLNPVQKNVIYHITTKVASPESAFMLLHGPPGTGKTKTIVGVVTQLLRQASKDTFVKILICTPSNLALDEIITRLDEIFKTFSERKPLMVRIGSEGDGDIVRKYSLESVCKKRCQESSVMDSLAKSIKQEEEKKEKIAKQIADLRAEKGSEAVLGGLYMELREVSKDIEKYKKEHKSELNSKVNFMGEEKAVTLRAANIICGTLNSVSSPSVWRHITKEIFTICIVDEATQATEPETLSPLMFRGVRKMLMVGDPNQLPATIITQTAKEKDFDLSLFKRHFDYHENRENNPVMALTIQYRMHPEIVKWPNDNFYKGMLRTATSVEEDDARKLRVIPYLFLNLPSQEMGSLGKIMNPKEIELIISLLQTLENLANIDPKHKNLSIGIITPYQEQRRYLHQALADPKNKIGSRFRETIEANTVDSFQGKEKDIILMSCVRTGELGFLKARNRLNVALTRAKMSLIVIGCAESLNSDSMWKSLIDDAKRRNLLKNIPNDYTQMSQGSLRSFIEKTILLDKSLAKK